ncbi:hypothetical protein PF011_g8890 [Phytophthora fragariae]|uniref:Rotatin N-terminal domain-containing protein n=1 Tax=Phytophthora fragariae TaxID=53985 RepID=A0A6A3KYS8_9STRA|nr:hypothetical protein PF011_g8890 [Phytophthora fragariae]
MAEDGAAGRLDALVLKLRHPLAKIRARTLQSLLFKLRERLVRWQELEPLHNSLVPALLASLEPPLELQALHVLQLLVQSQSEILLASLQRCGAAQTLQRGANSNAELRAMYEKLLRQIYVFKVASKEENREQVSYSKEEEEQEEEVAAKEEKVWASRVLDDRRRGPKVDELEARGWRFAQVTLASVDEQFLFEFEVKLRLRTETQDLVAACAAFRNDLLRNFPAEVFLQRPAVLQYLLHLVLQPILLVSPGTTSERRDALVERAMEVSMGVNYFDEMMNSTFSNKRGNLPGAVVMASVKAIESFLFALKLTRNTCLNPTHVVHAPSVHVELFDSYDTRRVLYPRARVESGVGVDRIPERRADIDQLEQYSLSGAIYRIFMSVLPLLRSARHPRLHLLNLLITALPDLLEKGGTSAADIHIQKLDKMRLERIFEVLGGICRPVPLDQAGCGIIDPDLEFTHSMTWKIVELVLRLLHLYPSSRYCVDTVPSNADTNKYGEEGDRDVILIPPVLWQAVKLWAANSLLAEVAAEDWNDESLVQNLSKIDETIPAFVNLKHSSQEDARMIVAFVEFAKAHRDQLTNFGHWEKPPIVSLEVAQKAIRIRNVFDNTDAEAIADATLQAIWTRLSGCGNQQMGQLSESDIETIGFILCDQLSDQGEKQTPMARFFRGLMDLVNNISNETNGVPAERRRQFVNEVLCDSKFLMLLLLCLARLGGGADDQANSAAFWEILHFALNQLLVAPSDNLVQLQPVIPLLQHFAYIEPSEGSSSEQRSTQPQLADILNRVETSVPDNARYILISRCLLHESSYIRKSAASGVIRLVSQLNPETLGWITKEKEIREDPFGCSFVRDDKRLSLDTTLMESPLPVTRTYDYQPSENELSSQLSKLTHLRKVISGTSSAFEGMREAAFKELVMLIENAPVELFALFEELDKLADFIDLYSSVYATEPVLHAVMLEVLLRFARPMDENADTRLSPPSREKIRKRLTEMLSPLLTIVCRHRVPGSFLERDVFIVGSQCMVAILRTLPRESLLASDSPLQHTDSNILLDGSWASRFLFDHVSPIRELGFLAIAHSVSLDPLSSRLLEMAFETSTDDTESDAVRAAACNVLTKEVLRFNEYPPDQQSAMVETFRGSKFAGRALCSLSNTLKTPKVFASTASAFARLVRVLYMQSENLVSQFGDIQKELMAAGEDDIYPVLIQALSLREWKNSCNRYCSGCMLLPRCDEDAWRCSLLPAILDLMIELLNLFQAVCRDAGYDQVTFFLMHTTLQYQLMELVGDIHTSFDDTRPKATLRKQYEVLELCAGTLSILLVQAFDQHSECDTKQFGAPRTSGFGASFVAVVEKLLESHHPIDFRVSFSRVVPAISLLIPGSLHSSDVSVINALCSAVFDLSQEIAEFRPLSANSAASAQSELQGRVFPLTSIRRVSCALQVLLETCPSLQQFVQIQRSLPFALTSIKESFSAIRIAGGFGGKRARGNSSNSQDAYVLDLCGRIQTHMEVISAIIAGNKENQRLAKDDGLLTVILSNWNVMKAAHVRGSQLLLRALHLLANYTYGNDSAKASMLVSLSQGSGKISGGGNALLPQLFGFASTRGEVALSHQVANGAVPSSAEDIGLSNAACQVLKTVMLNTECVLASMKTGSVPKMVDSLQDRLKQTRQTSKIHHLENENLAHMLNVLSSIACNEEGARVLYASWATVVSLVFDDTMHSSDSQIRRSGCLLMRNLALSQATKNNFGMWEDLLDEIVATSVRVANTEQGDLTALRYLSAALWSLVYDNQKARALLLSRPAALHQLQQVLTSQQSESERVPEIVENLRRVMMLVQE